MGCGCRAVIIMLGTVSRAWQIVKFLHGADTSVFVSASARNHVLYPSFCLSVIKKFITECPPTVSAIFLSSFCFTLLYNVGVKLE